MIDWLKRSHIEPEIELNGISVPIVLKRHATAKRLTMRLAPDGSEVRITMPRWARGQEAIAFAKGRADWLAEQLAKTPERQAPRPGGTFRYRGRTLQIAWDDKAPRKPVLDGDTLTLGGPREGVEQRLQRWLEAQALSLFEGDIADYTAAASLDPVPVGLSRAQRRWGSCSAGGALGSKRIRINWRLVQAPDPIRRSVVAHEVAHLVHFDHSPAFHALLARIYEGDIKEADHWLKANGRRLYANFG
ncbi:M48 family metallopeptidase [Erythrobacter sp. SCSIO 43205]|uniref:M48 family metallopeptidase n=1 Tax=Erythrobacter sp. SCSIO 43205 TaxID=2779361 RepID=UPI001CA915D0|nr:SprT family zinc-dependent metalloprotease [Erythrobacter sp. SCSIO 43205]UAB78877.1 M48 family metallopeptidase [Erythrobacter sp. SCSIO 43205]